MDISKFMELAKTSRFPFVYTGERLNDAKVQKVIGKLRTSGTVQAFIAEDSLIGLDGLAITEHEITFILLTGTTGKIPKTKGVFPFERFILHDVTVKKNILPRFDVEFLLYNKASNKSMIFRFALMEDNIQFDDSMAKELETLFKTLTSTTGTEYIEPAPTEHIQDNNVFDFVFDDIHTTITMNADSIVINKQKIEERTKIQSSLGSPVTILKSALGTVKKGRGFSFKVFLRGVGAAICLGLIPIVIFGGIVVGVILCILVLVICIRLAFLITLTITRKDGTKFVTQIDENHLNNRNYERLMNVIFT